MDNDSRIVSQPSAQGQSQIIAGQVISGQGMDAGDWRTQMLPATRERFVNRILDSLRRYIPFTGQEGMQGPKMLAVNLEEKIFVAATSQADYLREISLKLPAVETQFQNPLQPASHQYYAAIVEAQRMDPGGWKAQLQPDSRQRIVNKIMDTLKRHLPFSGQEGLQEIMKIAVRFEEKIYGAAISQSDYLRKISVKMLTMERNSVTPSADNPPQQL